MIASRCIVFYALYRIALTVSSLLCCVTEHIAVHCVARQCCGMSLHYLKYKPGHRPRQPLGHLLAEGPKNETIGCT